jgi:hypothetical protein
VELQIMLFSNNLIGAYCKTGSGVCRVGVVKGFKF